jgi:plasmid stabilization system protein ParE
MAVDYSFKFTEKAEEDLDCILQYISDDLSNPSAANTLAQKIFNSIDNVRAFPGSGLPVENKFLADKNIRKVLVENYSIYYKADDTYKIIYIIRLVYSKRDFNEIAKTI